MYSYVSLHVKHIHSFIHSFMHSCIHLLAMASNLIAFNTMTQCVNNFIHSQILLPPPFQCPAGPSQLPNDWRPPSHEVRLVRPHQSALATPNHLASDLHLGNLCSLGDLTSLIASNIRRKFLITAGESCESCTDPLQSVLNVRLFVSFGQLYGDLCACRMRFFNAWCSRIKSQLPRRKL